MRARGFAVLTALLALQQLSAQLLEADIIISSTAAPAYLLTRSDMAAAMRSRRHRPLCIVDLGVPRNVDPSIGGLENVYLFNIDDLQGMIEHSHQRRQEALGEALAIIDRKVDRFVAWSQEEVAACVPSCSGPAEVP